MIEPTAAPSGAVSTAPPAGAPGQLRVIAISEIMGAEIENVDLAAPLLDDAFRRISCAFIEHKLLVFRNQRLSPTAIHAFAERFGPVEGHNVACCCAAW